MLYLLLSLVAVTVESPFPYEIDRGLMPETFVGYTFNDVVDDAAPSAGLRISYARPDQEDAYVTGVLQFTGQYLLDDGTNHRKMKYLGEALVSINEIFNPMTARFELGGGIERRFGKNHPVAVYRGGLGYYFNSQLGLMGDLTFRWIFRNLRDSANNKVSQTSAPIEATLALRYIF